MDEDSDISGISRNMNLTGASSVASVELDEASEDPQDEVDGAAAAAAVATTRSPERKLPQMLTTATR